MKRVLTLREELLQDGIPAFRYVAEESRQRLAQPDKGVVAFVRGTLGAAYSAFNLDIAQGEPTLHDRQGR